MRVKRIKTVLEDGGRVDWLHSKDLIALDYREGDGYHDIYLMSPDGSNLRPLTSGKAGKAPQKHNGNPAWHPSGEFIVFQAEKEEHPLPSMYSVPGWGLNSDIWLMTSDGEHYWQLTDLDVSSTPAVLHPHFSKDGKRLLWTNRVGAGAQRSLGLWELRIADFVTDPKPHLENERSYRPGPVQHFYESHGFFDGDRKVLITANMYPDSPDSCMDICTVDIKTGEVTNLTQMPGDWNEHAHLRPQGDKIVWLSSKGLEHDPSMRKELSGEYWAMNIDGSSKERLTYFNDPNHEHWMGFTVVVGDNAWSGDGSRFMGYAIYDRPGQHGRNLLIEVED